MESMDSNRKRNRAFAMHSSQEISEIKARSTPRIRVVYIIPPKIIETDAANFRALVQKLTGKDSCCSSGESMAKSKQKKFRSVVSLEQNGSPRLKAEAQFARHHLCSNRLGQPQFLSVEDQYAKVKSEFIEDHSLEFWDSFSCHFEGDGDLDMFTPFDLYQQLPLY